MYHKSEKIRGFTLIECLVSIFILVIIFAAGITIFIYSRAALAQAVDRRMALESANAEMENIRNNGYASLSGTVFCSSGNSDLWDGPDQVNIAGLTGQRSVFVCDDDFNGSDYKRVRVEVSWQHPDRTTPDTVSLTTIIASP
jgi:prepilin-type N-terminal cleavage/methylation domain-containing protein